MYKISNEEVDFILNDIKAQGIQIEDLQYNLLDHICCIIENEMPENENFYNFYQKIIPTFFNTNLKEIQTETRQLLDFKYYTIIQKLLKISGLIAVLMIIAGLFSRVLEWEQANIIISLGAWLFGLVFIPLMIVLKFKDEDSVQDKWILSFGFFLALLASVGIGFKLMHFPYANALIQSSSILFLCIYLPLYYILRAKKAELKFNTTIHAILMMVFGGMLFSLSNSKEKDVLTQDIQASCIQLEQTCQSIQQTNQYLYKKLQNNPEIQDFHEKSMFLITKIIKIKKQIRASSKHPVAIIEENSLNNEISEYNRLTSVFFPQEHQYRLMNLPTQETNQVSFLLKLTQIQLQILSNENYLFSFSN
ncbi:MAG: hypothetical protein MUC49_05690 [Raineya sp.]|jgi:hypothetical protein|nr:hypothetical protein [Raineya sp.]